LITRLAAILAAALGILSALPAAAQSVAAGRELYMNVCLVCHGDPPVGGPDRAGNNPDLIRNAVNSTVPTMSFLRGLLTNQDYINIAAYIASLSAPVNPGGLTDADNVTGLWWNAAESGWGLNINHQGNIMFGSLFTYEAGSGTTNRGMWLVLPSGAKQADGSFQGALYQTTGPAFSASPFAPIGGSVGSVTQVGTMTLRFASATRATLDYTANGLRVLKDITPQAFARQQACSNVPTVAGGRAARTNYTDLWWVPAESGWGINVTHQDDTLFATLFSYEAGTGTSNRGMWLVMSGGVRQADGSYSGDLFRTTGPGFNALPFTSIGAANLTRAPCASPSPMASAARSPTT
jgi:cytochrome c553